MRPGRTIVHIDRPSDLDPSAFEVFMPPPVGGLPRPTLGSVEAWAAPDGAVETGSWEGDARHFLTDDGRHFEFKAGDAAYFPPRTHGTWTIHETLRQSYCIWR